MNIKDLKGIKSLIQLMGESDLTEITLEEDNVKLTLKRDRAYDHPVATVAMAPPIQMPVASPLPAQATPTPVPDEDPNLHYITAPLVGTLYLSPAPDADAYVKVGDKVKKGQTLCIIEAMKLMNEIEAEVDGTIVELLVDNATPIDFGAKIIAMKPN